MNQSPSIAIVTGAGRGIGRAIATTLAAQGSTVYCADIDAANAAETARLCGGGAQGVSLDVSSTQDVEALTERVVAEHGRLDISVANAGINRDAMLHKMTDEQWHTVIDIDLTAVFTLTRAVTRIMRAQRSGRIINISSASWLGNIGQANYAAAKAGVVGLTLTAARELGRSGVTANAICPGFIDSDMTRGLPESVHAAQLAKIPLGRAGTGQDVANVVAFLASEQAAYVTGEVINVGGGYRI